MILKEVEFYYEKKYRWFPTQKFSVMKLKNIEAEELDEWIRFKNAEIYSFEGDLLDFVKNSKKLLLQIESLRPIEVLVTKAWQEKKDLCNIELKVIEN